MLLSTLTVTTSIPAFVVAPQLPATPRLLVAPRPLALLPAPRSLLQLAPPPAVALLAPPTLPLALCAPLGPRARFERDLVALLDRHAAPVRLVPDRIGTPTLIIDAVTGMPVFTVTMLAGGLTIIRFPKRGGERRYEFRLQDPVALHQLVMQLTRRFVA